MKKRIYSWLFGLLLPCLSCFVAGAQEDKVSLTTNAAVGGEVALALNEEAVVGDALQFLRDGVNAIGNPCKWYKVVRPEVEITGKIKKIEATSFRIKSLKIESAPDLEEFFAEDMMGGNQFIQEADFSKCPKIKKLGIQQALLEKIDVKGLQDLSILALGGNKLSSLDVTGCTSLGIIFVHRNQIKKDNMKVFINSLPSRVDKDKGFVVLVDLHPSVTDEGNVCTPDLVKVAIEKNWAIRTAANEDYKGENYQPHVSNEVIKLTTALTVGQGENYIPLGLEAYEGEDFEVEGGTYHSTAGGRRYYLLNSQNLVIKGKIKSLNCSDVHVTSLDISGNPELESLNCSSNANLSNLVLGTPKKLKVLNTSNSPVGAINISAITTLEQLFCINSNIPKQDLSGLVNLRELNCSGNKWMNINVKSCTKLEKLFAAGCNISQIDLSQNTLLREVQLHVNYLRELTLHSPKLISVIVFDNEIEGEAMTNLVKSLPQFVPPTSLGALEYGQFVVYRKDNQPEPDKNKCLVSDVRMAMDKDWKVFSVDMNDKMEEYEGIQSNALQSIGSTNPSVYPSPATEWIEVSRVEPGTEIVLYNLSGSIALRCIAEAAPARISVAELPSGVYYVQAGDWVQSLIIAR